ncbi:hypothetical protein PILCRDRAFT_11823 [Piloderma croceum F 1598]|uniref:Uncharacterized protein n=1 Tax=Piloderma croceum (strain F 1598) TaxID=765440 RepID=A0A0C3EYX4_PILCF|nr:hypothetical protein PILCRDRAFT_11823 [Piloderma croceum F 1598]
MSFLPKLADETDSELELDRPPANNPRCWLALADGYVRGTGASDTEMKTDEDPL